MPKKFKVKRYYGINSNYYKSKPATTSVFLLVLLFVALAATGVALYRPVYDYVMNFAGEPESSQAASESLPEELPVETVPPEPEPVPEPDIQPLRAAYAGFETVSSAAKLDEFIASLSGTDINAVMVDIKNANGDILYKTENQQARDWKLIAPDAIDLKALTAKLEESNLSLVVKMSVFRDPKAASAGRTRYAITYQNSGYLWLDASPEAGGRPWLNPYSAAVGDYVDFFALEAADMGAKMVVLENLQFPDGSAVYATFGENAAAMSRREILKATVLDLEEKLSEKGARVAVYMTALVAAQTELHDIRYGGSPLLLAGENLLLDASPSQFASGFYGNGLEIKDPLKQPAEAVRAAISYAKEKAEEKTTIIPLLHGGNAETFNQTVKYTADDTSAQIKICEELCGKEYFLYNQSSEYLIKR